MELSSLTQSIPCAICGTADNYRIRYKEENLNPSSVTFPSREVPRRHHYQTVECNACGLVYSNPIFLEDKILQLYRDATEYPDDIQFKKRDDNYDKQFQGVLPLLKRRDAFLEIGCASGSFLKRAKAYGFKEVFGIELGEDAIRKADSEVRPWIVHSEFKHGLFPADYFDAVCSFQVLDHVRDPNEFVSGIYTLLRKGGIVLGVNHNIRSLYVRLVGRRCHMYCVDHIYLFDTSTVRKLLEKHGFEVVTIESIFNSYTLDYCIRLLPFPPAAKTALCRVLHVLKMAHWTIRAPGGNMLWVARKRNA